MRPRSLVVVLLSLTFPTIAAAQVLNTNPGFNTDYLPWGWFYICAGTSGPPCGSTTPTLVWSPSGNPGGSAQVTWNAATYTGASFGVGNYGALVSIIPGATYNYSANILVQSPSALGSPDYFAEAITYGATTGTGGGFTPASAASAGVWFTVGGSFVAAAGSETAQMEAGVPEVSGASYLIDNVSISGPRGPGRAVGFTASPTTITAGQTATLTWTSVDATTATLNGVAVSGCCADTAFGNQHVSVTVSPTTTTTYTLVSTGSGGPSTWSGPPVTVTVNPPSCPTMTSSNVFVSYNGSSSGCHAGTNCTPNEAVSFTVAGSGYNFSCASHTFSWNFGDGGTATGQNVTHAFAAGGNYTVSATINNGTQTFTATTSVQVTAPPTCPAMNSSNVFIDYHGFASACRAGSNCYPSETITFDAVGSGYDFGCATHTYSWNFGDGTGSASGNSVQHKFAAIGTYTVSLTISNVLQTFTTLATVVVANPPAPTASISVSPQTITAGQSAVLTWSTTNATSILINNASVAASGSITVQPTVTTAYSLDATGPGGTATASATLTVKPAVPLRIVSFTAAPPTIRLGDSATLAWATEGAASVSIDHGVGTQPPSGTTSVKPSTTTTYTLTAFQGATGSTTQTLTVEVLTGAVIDVTALPQPLVQVAGVGGALTAYGFTNSGGASSTITITQDGDFFIQSPTSFTIGPGQSELVVVQGKASTAGVFDGAVHVSGAGVPPNLQIPIRLLSTPAPTGSVTADSQTSRVDVAAPATVNPTGSVSFTNHGSVTLTGVLTSDVPWIIPQAGVVTIAPGATVTLTFAIDRSKRPDANALIGSADGNLRLSFLTGGTSFAKRAFDGSSSNVSVELVRIVDTVQTNVAPGNVPALGAGEVAVFIPGVGHFTRSGLGTSRLEFLSDVSMLNSRGNRTLDDVKLYYTPTSGSTTASQTTSIPPTAANVSVAIADAAKNIFGANEQIGTLHVRSKDAASLAVAATSIASGNPSGALGTDLPVMRSDRAARPSETVVLTGLRKDSSAHSDLYVQETSGADAKVTIDFVDANGAAVGSQQTTTIDAFKLREMQDSIPAGAVAGIVTNTSTNSANILAYATIVDEQSKDTWIVSDWSRQLGYAPTEPVVVPIAGNLHGANGTFYRTDLAITNRGSVTANATLRYTSRTGASTDKAVTIAPRATTTLADAVATYFGTTDDVGYITFTPSAGAFAITGRTYSTTTGQTATFSSSIPVVAPSAALPKGGSKIVAALEDADRRTLAANRPGTFRTNVALVETTGNAVTVRVTLRFTFPAGLSAQGVGSSEARDYSINPHGFLLLNSIADELLAAHRLRDIVGDLKRVEANFQVVSGDGQVIVVTSSVDNRSGDSIIRNQ